MKNEESKKEPSRMLRRSESDKLLGGVAAGIADYFEVDVNLVRFIFVMLALLGGSGFLLYAILWVLMRVRGLRRKRCASAEPG
jgi:phage shock protein PspC (stress-responsive transcriptional regulator)